MANEQTSVPLYAALEVLTAASLNISAGTGVPVFATTVTRDAAFGGANEKTLAEGQLCYLSASNIVQYYDGAAWATVGPASSGALVYLKGASPSAALTVSIDDVFSATYENYLIKYNLTTGGALRIELRVGGVTTVGTSYNSTYEYYLMTASGNGLAVGAGLGFWAPQGGAALARGTFNIYQPFTASSTSATFESISEDGTYYFQGGAQHTGATSFDGVHFLLSAGTMTGNIRIYGITNS